MLHTDAVEDARFDGGGARLVTASDDGTARVWDAATGRPLGPPLRPHGGVRAARFSPDGRFVLTRNADAVQVWDAATGTPALLRFAPEQPVAGAGFSPDSRRLWVVSEQPRLHAVDLTPGNWSADDWQFAARFLSCREVDATGGLVAWSPRPRTAAAPNADEAATRWERLRQELARSPSAPDR
jgi:WD40 repeat protein